MNKTEKNPLYVEINLDPAAIDRSDSRVRELYNITDERADILAARAAKLSMENVRLVAKGAQVFVAKVVSEMSKEVASVNELVFIASQAVYAAEEIIERLGPMLELMELVGDDEKMNAKIDQVIEKITNPKRRDEEEIIITGKGGEA